MSTTGISTESSNLEKGILGTIESAPEITSKVHFVKQDCCCRLTELYENF